jgi:hypothetical protein
MTTTLATIMVLNFMDLSTISGDSMAITKPSISKRFLALFVRTTGPYQPLLYTAIPRVQMAFQLITLVTSSPITTTAGIRTSLYASMTILGAMITDKDLAAIIKQKWYQQSLRLVASFLAHLGCKTENWLVLSAAIRSWLMQPALWIVLWATGLSSPTAQYLVEEALKTELVKLSPHQRTEERPAHFFKRSGSATLLHAPVELIRT